MLRASTVRDPIDLQIVFSEQAEQAEQAEHVRPEPSRRPIR